MTQPQFEDRPWSAACDRNRDPILDVLRVAFVDRRDVLEIGSGTGQHAAHFAAGLPHLRWHSSDRAENLPGIRQWLDGASLPDTPPPRVLDVDGPWPDRRFDALFSANTLHILSWPQVQRVFERLPSILMADAVVAIYGPFNIDGQATSRSNAEFDAVLRARAAHMGLRDVGAVDTLARTAGLDLADDIAMPANNRLLIWRTRVLPPANTKPA